MVASLCAVAGLGMGASACQALLGDFQMGVPSDAGTDGIEGSASDGAAGDAVSDARATSSDGDTASDASARVDGGEGGAMPDAVAVTPPAPLPLVGEVMISEVMFDPAPIDTVLQNTQNQWIEVYNAASTTRLLSGLTIADSAGESHTIASTPWVTIAPHAYQLLVADATQLTTVVHVPAASIAYQYAGIALTADGGVSLSRGSTLLSQVSYGGWGITSQIESSYAGEVVGASIELSALDAGATSPQTSWCIAQTVWWTSQSFHTPSGTPGMPSDCDAGH